MKKIQYARPELVEPIQKELNLAPDTPLREKLDRIEKFCKKHPQLSKRFVCGIVGVDSSTLHRHMHRNKRGKTVYAERRKLALLAIEIAHPDKSKPVIMGRMLRRLDEMHCHVSFNTLRSILNENNYKTLKINQNL